MKKIITGIAVMLMSQHAFAGDCMRRHELETYLREDGFNVNTPYSMYNNPYGCSFKHETLEELAKIFDKQGKKEEAKLYHWQLGRVYEFGLNECKFTKTLSREEFLKRAVEEYRKAGRREDQRRATKKLHALKILGLE